MVEKWSTICHGQLWGRHRDENYVCIIFSYHYNNPLIKALQFLLHTFLNKEGGGLMRSWIHILKSLTYICISSRDRIDIKTTTLEKHSVISTCVLCQLVPAKKRDTSLKQMVSVVLWYRAVQEAWKIDLIKYYQIYQSLIFSISLYGVSTFLLLFHCKCLYWVSISVKTKH